jgi:hypothetical protein
MVKSQQYESIIDKIAREIEENEGIQPYKMKITNERAEFGFPEALKMTVGEQLKLASSPLAPGERPKFKPNAQQKADGGTKKQLQLPASSTIQQAAFWPTKEYLVVSFKSGHTYSYNDVPLVTVLLWEQSSSAGSWFYYNIRMSYRYQKMG